jgi:hypothetical protein
LLPIVRRIEEVAIEEMRMRAQNIGRGQRMNTTAESATHLSIRAEKVDPETERIILDRLASFDEDAETAVDAREALLGIRRDLKHVSPR